MRARIGPRSNAHSTADKRLQRTDRRRDHHRQNSRENVGIRELSCTRWHPRDDLETSLEEGNKIQKIFSSDKAALHSRSWNGNKGNKEMRIAIAGQPSRRVSRPDQDPPELLQKCSKQRKRVLNECARDRTSKKADEGENAADDGD